MNGERVLVFESFKLLLLEMRMLPRYLRCFFITSLVPLSQVSVQPGQPLVCKAINIPSIGLP